MLIPAADEAGGHGGDDAGDMEGFAQQIGRPGHQHGRGDHQIIVTQPPDQQHPDGADRAADHQPADGEQDEAFEAGDRAEAAGCDGGDGEAEEDQAAGVVEQAFALQQDRQAAGEMDALQHGAGGNGVGRRDDGAQRGAGGPGQGRHQGMGDRGDHERGEDHRADRQ